MRDSVVFKRGQVVCFTTGSYSDYMIESHFRVLREFDRDWARKEYLATQFGMSPEQEGETAGKYLRLNVSAFLVWLGQSGFVQELRRDCRMELR